MITFLIGILGLPNLIINNLGHVINVIGDVANKNYDVMSFISK